MVGLLTAVALGAMLSLLVSWLRTKHGYKIGRSHLVITFLGFAVRRIPLADIKAISARRLRSGEYAEHWESTMHTSRRYLLLRLRSGWRKYVLITPGQRYVFREQLQAAMARLSLPIPGSDDTESTDAEESGSLDRKSSEE